MCVNSDFKAALKQRQSPSSGTGEVIYKQNWDFCARRKPNWSCILLLKGKERMFKLLRNGKENL